MKTALGLARKAQGRTSPNPLVGAVIVKGGEIISGDYHRKAGLAHAEALAIEKAGRRARGGTLYVTLEPCCHVEKRTPPCTKAIIGAGIKRVVAAMKDPNPKVSGKGFEELGRSGIKTTSGVLEEEAKKLNEPYIKYITTGRPFVILKVAMTLDGKIADPSGGSKWITSEKSRLMVHRLRSSVDAVLTAIGTVKADDPELTARIKGGKNPLRVLIDPNLETPEGAKILKTPPETVIVTKADDKKINKIIKTGIYIIKYKEKLELPWLIERLGGMGVQSLLIEGGSSLAGHALSEGIIDKVMFFVAPKILGGKESYPAVGGGKFRAVKDAFKVREMKARRVGEDLLIEGYVCP